MDNIQDARVPASTISTCRPWSFWFGLFIAHILFAGRAVANADGTLTMAPKSDVLIPLYIYPANGAWDPLYQAISTHPSLRFTIVINPANGPGPTELPDVNYSREISRLNTFKNVEVIGYVPLNYGRRDAAGAHADIAKYVQWRQKNPSLVLKGIFLDESPQIATDQNRTFLEGVKTKIRSLPEFAKSSIGKIIRYHSRAAVDSAIADAYAGVWGALMNPGSIPNPILLGPPPDLDTRNPIDRTVVFEDQYQIYLNRQAARGLASLPAREALCLLVHSIPSDMPSNQMRALTNELRELAGTLFLTDSADGYYQSFSPRFQEYIDALN